MLFNLLSSVQDNYQSGSDNTIFEAQIFSTAQQWIIGIVTFAVFITIFATIVTYCLYGISNKSNKIVKYTILIIGIIIAITFIILGVEACKAID